MWGLELHSTTPSGHAMYETWGTSPTQDRSADEAVPRGRTGQLLTSVKLRRALHIGLLIGAGMLLTFQALSYRYVSDDAFISFRYAQNWANGYGPVYNVDERVEGYTNFLWTAILAGIRLLGGDIVLAAQALGIVLGWAILLLTYLLSRQWHPPGSFWPLLAPILLALNLSFAIWATGGLETHLFTFLLLLSVFLHLQELKAPSRFPWSGLVMALCTMTRPEGLIMVGLAGLHRLWAHRGRIIKQDLLWGLGFAILYVPYYVWRWSYYGYPFPNTFYAKVGGGIEGLRRGIEHVAGFVLEYGGGPLIILVIVLAIFRRERNQFDRDLLFLALVVGSYMAYVIWIGGDALIEYRFLLPVTPLLYLLIQESLCRIEEVIRGWQSQRANALRFSSWIVVAAMLLVWVYLLIAQPAVQESRQRVVHTRIRYEGLAVLGHWLREQVPSEASLAVHHAGAMPFYSRLATIDMYGLTDTHIAHLTMQDMGKGYAGHEKHDVEYVLSRKPTYIAPIPTLGEPLNLEEWRGRFDQSEWFPDMQELLASPAFEFLYAPRSIDLKQQGAPGTEDVLKNAQFFNFFQVRSAAIAETHELVWDFGENGTEAWVPSASMELQRKTPSSVSLLATDADASIDISGLHWWATPCDRALIRMRMTAGADARIYWTNRPADQIPVAREARLNEFRSLAFPVQADGAFHTYEVPVGDALSWAGTISDLVLAPADQPSEVEIDDIRLGRECKAAEGSAVRAPGAGVLFLRHRSGQHNG
jgi:hypothetical protein